MERASLFLNRSFGIGPEFSQSGIGGPSIFPRTSAGLRVAVKPTSNLVLRAALMDGVPVVRPDGSRAAFRGGDGLLGVVEFASLSRGVTATTPASNVRDRIGRYSALPSYQDKLAFGAWRYSGRYADLNSADTSPNQLPRRGSSGGYVVGERLMIGAPDVPGPRLSAFGQAGFSDARTNRFSSYLGAGIVGAGWGPIGDTDEAGVSIARARNGNHYMQAAASTAPLRAETTIELSFLTNVSKYTTLQPDMQYVIHPNTDPALANALVFQLRVEIAF